MTWVCKQKNAPVRERFSADAPTQQCRETHTQQRSDYHCGDDRYLGKVSVLFFLTAADIIKYQKVRGKQMTDMRYQQNEKEYRRTIRLGCRQSFTGIAVAENISGK